MRNVRRKVIMTVAAPVAALGLCLAVPGMASAATPHEGINASAGVGVSVGHDPHGHHHHSGIHVGGLLGLHLNLGLHLSTGHHHHR